MEFPLHPTSRFESARTVIRRPKEFMYFSFDEHHVLQPSSLQSLGYYYPPFIAAPGVALPPVDLSVGFEDWIKNDETVDGHLDALLEMMRLHEEERMQDPNVDLENVRIDADVVTWRGMMTKIMTAAYDKFSDFEMNATCYQGTIYIEENHPYALADKIQQNKRTTRPGEVPQEMMQYWGYKFENLSTLPKPWSECSRTEIESRDRTPVNNNPQYCSIVRTAIGSTSLLLAGEIDCVLGCKPDSPDSPIPWIELKTTAEPPSDTAFERQKFERKLLKFWAQSFLLGVPRIVVGFRSPRGMLARITEFETQKLPGIVSRGEKSWDGNVCINLTAGFLEFLRERIGGSEGAWRVKRRKGGGGIEVVRVEERGTGEVISEAFKMHRERLAGAVAKKKVARAEAEVQASQQ